MADEEMVEVSRRELADLLEACAEGGWPSGPGTRDPDHKGPTLKDAADIIRAFWDFREEVWNRDAERNGWVEPGSAEP